MWKNKKIVCVIPARLNSSRFPRKILASLHGKSLIEWVWNAAIKVSCFDKVVIAIDDLETASVIDKFGGQYLMTSQDCLSGTDRMIELESKGYIQGDVYVNWQADGPFISEQTIHDLLQSCDDESMDVWTLKKRLLNQEDILSPEVSKVVCDIQGRAMYFSRATLPFYRKTIPGKEKIYFKHIGLYAYSSKGLQKISSITPCDLERIEQLEQLRFLYHGIKVQVHETLHETLEIDIPEHLEKAKNLLMV
ncbi:MAG: 3-deoxy-manno-octulosonate cytidylyltransferase [Chlamydiae bacterium]|nr:3-deoxy-manno-octulosonate cytidylyltransferase [Chlamydiota bacterium]